MVMSYPLMRGGSSPSSPKEYCWVVARNKELNPGSLRAVKATW
jgi:hypothetical protein